MRTAIHQVMGGRVELDSKMVASRRGGRFAKAPRQWATSPSAMPPPARTRARRRAIRCRAEGPWLVSLSCVALAPPTVGSPEHSIQRDTSPGRRLLVGCIFGNGTKGGQAGQTARETQNGESRRQTGESKEPASQDGGFWGVVRGVKKQEVEVFLSLLAKAAAS